MYYLLLHLAAADSLLFALVSERNSASKDRNSDIVALAEEILKVENLGTDGKKSIADDLVAGLAVAAMNG
jgi:hypothetical protein